MQPKHSAIVAGLTLALSFGAVSVPAPAAAEEPTPGVASDATDIDKGLYTQQSFSGVLRSVQGVSFVNVTPEMKYFTKYESHGNYNQGFSYGDGYNALGYYQFDRRWSLIPFMKQVYNYNPEKYSMLKDAIDRGSEISNTSNAMYENAQLTELGRIAQEAFQGAYNTDPAEFSALQDAYAYNSYYAVTEAWLKSGLGIDISGRADCVKGMVWSITNMCGTGGCRDFFRWANLSNDMSDREFVTALFNSVVDNVATKFSSQPQYHEGWKNRYRNELKDCLVYIAEDEAAAAATPVQPEPTPAPDSNDDSRDDANDDRMDAPSTDADGDGSAGGTTNDGSTSNGSVSNGSAAGDSSSSSAGNTDSDASGSTGAGTSNSSTGSSDSSVGTGSNNGSGSDATPGSDASKDDSNKAPDVPVASPDKKPSFSEQLGSTLGSSLMAGVNNGSTQNKGNSDQVSTEKIEAAKGDSKDKASEKTESDKGSSSEEKSDKSEQKKDEDKKSESEEKDKSKAEGEKKQSEDDDKSGADNQVQEQNDSKTVTTTTTTTTTTKSSGGNMPKTGDLIVMASLASASLATLGATSIVSGKHKLDQQKKASGEDGLEE
ncbi:MULTISPECIES: hypothetical protein [unclassified Collinsella]|jgi:hypothetical protein|uniref:VgrG-related protein n=1 Tax=unclassified Collinsella TaxID=2637548 RepID=UPI001314BB91|nr:MULTISPECIES: hypothetical protein [unclassified Collinsella]